MKGVVSIGKSMLYIALAFAGFGVWSFIYPKIIAAIAYTLSLWKATGWRPKLKLNFEYWGEMLGYGKNVLFSNVIDYVLNNSSYILIGSMIGSTSLGIYTFAYDKSMMIVNNITYPITMISFPAFSRLKEHKEKLKNAFFKTIRLISIFTFPYALGQIILGREYINFVFGSKWSSAVIIFQILIVYSMLRSVGQCGMPMLQGVGKPHITLRLNLVYAPIFFLALYTGFHLGGIYGVGLASAIAGSLWALVYIGIVIKTLNWSVKDVYDAVGSSLFASLFMAGALLILKKLS
ncbi:MAG: oligosaccharide flippase family protein [Desulfobacterales bacterium]|nr:oligosaccharide flippase family protein [Desulfobacterales bacterium]